MQRGRDSHYKTNSSDDAAHNSTVPTVRQEVQPQAIQVVAT